LSALEAWVEQGKAPDVLIAERRVETNGKRSRPLCVYPKVARYDGRGNIDEASSFECK
jgi:feruloyl esterase